MRVVESGIDTRESSAGLSSRVIVRKRSVNFVKNIIKSGLNIRSVGLVKAGWILWITKKKQEVQKQERLKEKERINKAQAENKDKQFKSGGNKRSAGNNKVSSIKKWKHNRETSQLENNSVQLSDFPDLDKFGLEFSSFGSKRPKFESGLKAQEILEAHNFPQAPSCFNTLNNISNNTSNNQHITVQPTDNLQNWTFLPQENKNPDNSEIIVIDDLDSPVGSPKNVKTPLLSNDNLPPSMPLKVSLLGDKPISEDTDLRQYIEKLRSERESAVNFEGDDKDEYLFASKSTEVEKERTRLANKFDDTRKVNTRNIIGDREDKCPEGVDTELWSSMQAAKNLLDKSAENKQKYGGLKRIVSKTVKCDDIIILDDMIDTNPSRSRSGSNSSRNRSRSPRKSDRNRTSRRSKKRSRSRSKHRSRSRSRSPTRSRSKSRSLHTRKRSKSPKPRPNTSRIRSESPNRSFKTSSRDSPKRKSPTRRSTSLLAGSASYMISRNKNWYPTIITSFRNHYKQQSLQSNIIYLNLMFEKTSNDLSFVSFKSVSPQMLSIHSELFSEILTPDMMNNTEITNFVALPRNLKSDTIVLLMNYVHGFSLELNREINFEDFGFSFSELVISTLYFKLWDLLDDLQNFVLNYKSVRSDLDLDFEKVKQYVAVIPKPVFLPGLIEEGQIQFLPQF